MASPSAYQININCAVQANSITKSLQNMINYTASSISSDQIATMSVTLIPNTEQVLTVPGITKLQVISVQTSSPLALVDLSLQQLPGVPVVMSTTTPPTVITPAIPAQSIYMRAPANMHFLVFATGLPFNQISLKSSTACTVEVSIAGLSS